MPTAIWKISCCPPYPTATAHHTNVRSRTQPAARAEYAPPGVNNTGNFVDNMWCRGRGTVETGDVTAAATKE